MALREHRDDVLAEVRTAEVIAAAVRQTMQRIAGFWPAGCVGIGDERLADLEERIHEAAMELDLPAVTSLLAQYEQRCRERVGLATVKP